MLVRFRDIALVRSLLTVCLLVTLTPLGFAATDLKNPQFMERVQKGFHHIYNLDYPEARSVFESLRQDYPDHPAPPLHIASTVWLSEMFERQELDLDLFLAPSYFDQPTDKTMSEADRNTFFSMMEESQRLSEDLIAREPENKDARYFLGSSYGILASFYITIDHSKGKAFNHGKRAYKTHLELIQEDPEYHDAYMSVGLYEYVTGSLPWYIKWIATILGYSGSKERGFEYLALAAEKGQFIRNDALTLQMVLLVRERLYSEALKNVLELQQGAPKNFILSLNRSQILQKMGSREKALESYLEILEKAENRTPNYDRVPLGVLRYTIARQLEKLGYLEHSVEQFRLAGTSPDLAEGRKTLSFLQAGQGLDVLGQRQEAVQAYGKVLELRDYDKSHQKAKKYLKKPYAPRGRN